jgi:hypothetical protein
MAIQWAGQRAPVNGTRKILKNGKVEFPTLTGRMPLTDNGSVSPTGEEAAAHVDSGGPFHG